MTKINSKYIKDNVKCVHCGEGGKKLKRTSLQWHTVDFANITVGP